MGIFSTVRRRHAAMMPAESRVAYFKQGGDRWGDRHPLWAAGSRAPPNICGTAGKSIVCRPRRPSRTRDGRRVNRLTSVASHTDDCRNRGQGIEPETLTYARPTANSE